MPYVDEKTKDRLDCGHPRVDGARSAGQLTYKLQQEISRYIRDNGLSYQTLAECLGALEGCKADMVDRVLLPLEHRKREDNGDVWPVHLTETPESFADKISRLAALTGAPMSTTVGCAHQMEGSCPKCKADGMVIAPRLVEGSR